MGNALQAILQPGDVIGKYQVVRCLGIGGMGEVHLVLHQQLNVYRALKLLRTDKITNDPIFAERFMREARIASRIQHPNIISVMDVENDAASGFFYIVMEYVDGSPLQNLLRNGALSPDQAVHIISEVSKGLAAASELGLVHRDIKPANIMISQEGQVKLADLGIAKASGDDVGVTLTMANTVVGTPAYASPEQCRDAHDVDVRADIYSLGATLYELVTGLAPFDGANAFDIIAHVFNDDPISPRRLNPKVSPELEKLILRMMAKDPQQRPQTIAELQELLKPFLASDAAIPPELKSLIHERVEREVQARTSTVITAYRKRQNGERIAGLSVLLVLVIVAGIFVLVRDNRHHREIRKLREIIAMYQDKPGGQSYSRELHHRYQREIRQLKAEEEQQHSAAKRLAAQVAELKTKLENQKLEHRDRLAKTEQKIRDLNAEISRLKTQFPRELSKLPAQTQPPQGPVPFPAPAAAPAPSAAGMPAVHLTRKQYEEKSRIANQKARAVRSLILNQRAELFSAMQRLDAERIQVFFRQFDISFEDLSYIHTQNLIARPSIPNLFFEAVFNYNLGSSGWDTSKIYDFLSRCFKAGNRIQYMYLTYYINFHRPGYLKDVHLRDQEVSKRTRNYLDFLGFMLSRPDFAIPGIYAGMAMSSNGLVLRTAFKLAGTPQFPGWVERVVRQSRKNMEDGIRKSNCSLLDWMFMQFYQLGTLTPAHLQCLENLEHKYGLGYQVLTPDDRALIKAIHESDQGKVARMIREKRVDLRKQYPLRGNALFYASSVNLRFNPEIIRLLLKSGSPVKTGKFSYGRTPLAAAIDHNEADLVNQLIRFGANLNDTFALQVAVRRGNASMAEMLLKHNSRPSLTRTTYHRNGQRITTYDNDLLFVAMDKKMIQVAILLVETGVDLNRPRYISGHNVTPLQFAERSSELRPVADLIRRKLQSYK